MLHMWGVCWPLIVLSSSGKPVPLWRMPVGACLEERPCWNFSLDFRSTRTLLLHSLRYASHSSSAHGYVTCLLFQSCSGTGVEPLDRDVLLLKATSQAAVHSVKDCLALIKLQQQVLRPG